MHKRVSIPFLGILFGTAANMMMQTAIAAILPQIVSDLGGEPLYGWVFSGYLLLSTITIPFFAKLADAYGYRKFYLIGMTIFLLGSLMCGIAFSMPFLIASRMIQGLGAGALGPVTIALISSLFPLESRGKAMGMYAATQLLSNVAGPIFAGLAAHAFGWQWVFFMVLPVGFLSLGFIGRSASLQADQASVRSIPRLDVIGSLLLGASIALLIQGWTLLGQTGLNVLPVSLLIAALVLFVLFLFQEKHHENPVIPLSLIRIKNIRLANMSALLVGLLMYGAIAILPLYATGVLGVGSFTSGRLLITLMVGMGLGVIISGRLIRNCSYKALAQVGWITSGISLAAISMMSMWNLFGFWTYAAIFATGYGLGTLLPTFLLPVQNAVRNHEQAVVGGLVQLSRNLGGAVGIPVLTGILAFSSRLNFPSGSKYWPVFAFLAGCTLLGLFIGRQYRGSVREEKS